MSENVNFSQGTVIFQETQWEMCMYDIKSGRVGIYSAYGTPEEKLLTELEAGRFFGEMGLVEAMPRSATAVALTECTLVKLVSEDLNGYFKNEPEKVVAILQNMSRRLRELSEAYLDACNTVAEYVAAEEQKKPQRAGLMEKIRRIIAIGDEYGAAYSQMVRDVPDSSMMRWY